MRRLAHEDDGAIAVLVGIMLVMLLGFGAIAVDTGALFAERRELQNGADAGALAVAEDCARGLPSCALSVATGTADAYADDNTNDGAATAESVDLDLVAARVTVTTLTEDGATGANRFSLFFARVFGFDETEVRAQATARWGAAASATGFPLAVCQGLWDGNRPVPPLPGPTIDVRYKGTGGNPPTNDCLDAADDNFSPGNTPGNFSWLNTSGSCETNYDFSGGGYSAGGETGVAVPGSCSGAITDLISQIQAHKSNPANPLPVVILPIYSSVSGNGSNATYELTTLGAFELSGLKVGGSASNNVVVTAWIDPDCASAGANHLCMQGRFVREVALGTIDPAVDGDVLAVELTR